MVSPDLHRVIQFGRGPMGAKEAVLAEMDRVFFAQPLGVTPMIVIHERVGVTNIDVFQRYGKGIFY